MLTMATTEWLLVRHRSQFRAASCCLFVTAVFFCHYVGQGKWQALSSLIIFWGVSLDMRIATSPFDSTRSDWALRAWSCNETELGQCTWAWRKQVAKLDMSWGASNHWVTELREFVQHQTCCAKRQRPLGISCPSCLVCLTQTHSIPWGRWLLTRDFHLYSIQYSILYKVLLTLPLFMHHLDFLDGQSCDLSPFTSLIFERAAPAPAHGWPSLPCLSLGVIGSSFSSNIVTETKSSSFESSHGILLRNILYWYDLYWSSILFASLAQSSVGFKSSWFTNHVFLYRIIMNHIIL